MAALRNMRKILGVKTPLSIKFIKKYQVDMSEAVKIATLCLTATLTTLYPSHSFRAAPNMRTKNGIGLPCDGAVRQLGCEIEHALYYKPQGHTLKPDQPLRRAMLHIQTNSLEGSFAKPIYLSPKRITHVYTLPPHGKLTKMIHIT